MNNKNHRGPSWKDILQINMRFVGTILSLGYGYACWQMASKEWWGLAIMAVMAFIGGGIALIAACYKLSGILKHRRDFGDFGEDAVEARADRGVTGQDLKNQKITR